MSTHMSRRWINFCYHRGQVWLDQFTCHQRKKNLFLQVRGGRMWMCKFPNNIFWWESFLYPPSTVFPKLIAAVSVNSENQIRSRRWSRRKDPRLMISRVRTVSCLINVTIGSLLLEYYIKKGNQLLCVSKFRLS